MPCGAERSAASFISLAVSSQVRRDEVVRCFEAAAGSLFDRTIADLHFEAAGRAANVARAINIQAHVTQVPCASHPALDQSPVDNRCPADTRAKREHKGVATPTRSADPRFTEQRGVGVVQHVYRR